MAATVWRTDLFSCGTGYRHNSPHGKLKAMLGIEKKNPPQIYPQVRMWGISPAHQSCWSGAILRVADGRQGHAASQQAAENRGVQIQGSSLELRLSSLLWFAPESYGRAMANAALQGTANQSCIAMQEQSSLPGSEVPGRDSNYLYIKRHYLLAFSPNYLYLRRACLPEVTQDGKEVQNLTHFFQNNLK